MLPIIKTASNKAAQQSTVIGLNSQRSGLYNPDNRYLTTFLKPDSAYIFDIRCSTETQLIFQFMKAYPAWN